MALASFAFVVVAFATFLTNDAINIYTIVNALTKATPAALALGILGYFLGSIFDDKRITHKQPEKELQETEKTEINEEWDEI